jgi:hypothetical protein
VAVRETIRRHVGNPFDLDGFLSEPLIANVATSGPTVRPMDYQWEQGAFWIICGPWAKLFQRVHKDPEIALLIEVSEYDRGGRILQVMASGPVEVAPYDIPRALRMLTRYHGPDASKWSTSPADYPSFIQNSGPQGAVWLKLMPRKLLTFNFSYKNPLAT